MSQTSQQTSRTAFCVGLTRADLESAVDEERRNHSGRRHKGERSHERYLETVKSVDEGGLILTIDPHEAEGEANGVCRSTLCTGSPKIRTENQKRKAQNSRDVGSSTFKNDSCTTPSTASWQLGQELWGGSTATKLHMITAKSLPSRQARREEEAAMLKVTIQTSRARVCVRGEPTRLHLG